MELLHLLQLLKPPRLLMCPNLRVYHNLNLWKCIDWVSIANSWDGFTFPLIYVSWEENVSHILRVQARNSRVRALERSLIEQPTSSCAINKGKMWTLNMTPSILVIAFAFLVQASRAKNFERMILGQVFLEEGQEIPPRILNAGDCVEYVYPRKHAGRFGAIEACMQVDCNFEIRERGILIPQYSSDTNKTGLGSSCFLKLQDNGGLDILAGSHENPTLVKTLVEDEGKNASGSDNVGYEIILKDTYQLKKDYEEEYHPGRFTREPSLVINRIDWIWFVKDHQVKSKVFATVPASNYTNNNAVFI